MAREMKDSGIQWIGEIPKSWITTKIKNLPNNEENSYIDGDWIESPYITDNGIRYLTTGNIGDGHYKEQGDGYISEDTFIALKCKYAYPGDLVFSRLNEPYGRSCILPNFHPKYVLAVDNVILRTNENKSYICYISQCKGFQNSVLDMARGTTMKRISRINLGNVIIPLPSNKEQNLIASYLDSKCAEIDKAIETTKASIEEYRKLRQAIITEAVTKGLDPNVEMKDSGIEWIGEIPKYWRMTVISRIGNTCSGATPNRSNETSYFENANIRWVRTLDLNGGIVSDSSEKITEKALQESSCQIMPEGTVCIAMYGGSGTIGKCGLLSKPCTTNQAICSIVCDENLIVPKYLLYQMISIRKHWMLFAEGTRKDPNINQETVRKMSITLPPIKEQKDITLYLNTECSKIDSLIMSKEKLIEELTAYRKSLIFEYVTGKKEVPVESA